MAARHFGAVFRRIERVFTAGSVAGLSEGELLERFAARGDEAAFEAILARHGRMVLGICRRVLSDPNDVDDAFQATFLILVRKAGSLRQRDLLGNWLFGVASRVALRARSVAARRRTLERAQNAIQVRTETARERDHDHESGAILHQELRHLPEKYRTAILLCYLEGLTHEEAAQQLGWPLGTVKGRLSRARELLRKRLTRRGVVLSTSAVSSAVARQAEAAVPAALVQSTIKAGLAVAAGRTLAAGVVAANVATLMKGASNAMFLYTLKLVAMLLVAGVLTTGAGVWAFQASGSQAHPARQATPKAHATVPASVIVRSGREAIADLAAQLAARDKTLATQAILAKLQEPLSMSFANETRLEDVLKYIQMQTQGPNDTGIPIYVDLRALREQKIDPKTAMINMNLEGIPLRTSLRLALKQLNLAYCVTGGMVIISSVDGILEELKEAEAAEAGAEKFPPPPPLPAAKANEAVKAAPGELPFEGPTAQESPQPDIGLLKSEALQKRLDEPVNVAFPKETPLEDVFGYLRKATQTPDGSGLPIYVDPSEQEKFKRLVHIDLQGVPLRTTLTLLLNQVELAWSLQDGLLIIAKKVTIQRIALVAGHFTLARRFDAPITLSFPEKTPLTEVITAIRKATRSPEGAEIPIYLGPAVRIVERVSETVGIAERAVGALPVQIDLKDVPLRTCLALLLAQPKLVNPSGGPRKYDLDGQIVDGVLIIGENSWLQSLQILERELGGGREDGGDRSVGGGGLR